MSNEEFKYPKWQSEFDEAIVEFDSENLAEKIKNFELAAFVRLQELACNSDHHDERQAIADALSTLREVKRDKCEMTGTPSAFGGTNADSSRTRR